MGKNEIINDNELLYLIREGNEQALEIMYKKYVPLMEGKLNKFNIETEFRDDFYQESRLMLHKAIRLYNPNSSKTFNKYFDLILTNQMITILRKTKKDREIIYLVDEEVEDRRNKVVEDALDEIDYSKLKLSVLEKEIYKLYFLRNHKVSYISDELKVEKKSIYNTIQRIKTKLGMLK